MGSALVLCESVELGSDGWLYNQIMNSIHNDQHAHDAGLHTSDSPIPLSAMAQSLWGKSDRGENQLWLPLFVHMFDAAHMAAHLWDEWVPVGTRAVIAREFGNADDPVCQKKARSLLVFLAGVHDIGKATPCFQSQSWFVPGSNDGEEDEGSSPRSGSMHSLIDKPQSAGFHFDEWNSHRIKDQSDHGVSHPLAGEIILGSYLQYRIEQKWKSNHDGDFHLIMNSLGCILGGHHGRQPSNDALDIARLKWQAIAWFNRTVRQTDSNRSETTRFDAEEAQYCRTWQSARKELLDFVWDFSDMDSVHLEDVDHFSVQTETLLTGIVIMADWLASDQDRCPLITNDAQAREEFVNEDGSWHTGESLTSLNALEKRDTRAWNAFDLEPSWVEKSGQIPSDDSTLFRTRFNLPNGASPRPVQRVAMDIARKVSSPGLLIIEAPMGEGKTEAALSAAEIFAHRTGRGGVCFALPTMATTDAMFGRVDRWLDRLPQDQDTGKDEKSVYLGHSKAHLNTEYQSIITRSQDEKRHRFASINQDEADSTRQTDGRDTGEGAVASDWFSGRKTGVLSNFVICTVDQVLMLALRMKHVVLRQLALANKVVIIDECHAYDDYMRVYLDRALEWLAGMGCPVILLSATLPASMRKEYVQSYQDGIWADTKIGVTHSAAENGTADLSLLFAPVAAITNSYVSRSAEKSQDNETSTDDEVLENAYPLLTYTDGSHACHHQVVESSANRSVTVHLQLIDDSDSELVDVLRSLVGTGEHPTGGCVGVICDTVSRAQHAAEVLSEVYGDNQVILAHSRFVDRDRMDNENRLRTILGPQATRGNGKRPFLKVIVGTQVLEQSLDIDFDAMICDIAPVDLLIQRLGRLHRHHRGEGECDRPDGVRVPRCFIRGIDQWNQSEPRFANGISWKDANARGVYPQAGLEESLGVLGLTHEDASAALSLPKDIAHLVRTAYDSNKQSSLIPSSWSRYDDARQARSDHAEKERFDAKDFLVSSLKHLVRNDQSLLVAGDDRPQLVGAENDKARCAVRDITDSVSVILMRRIDENTAAFLPWIGDEKNHIKKGAKVPFSHAPSNKQGLLMAQCSVALPRSVSWDIDALIQELEEQCGKYVLNWQSCPWIAGTLFVFLDSDGCAEIAGKTIRYTRQKGLEVYIQRDNESASDLR